MIRPSFFNVLVRYASAPCVAVRSSFTKTLMCPSLFLVFRLNLALYTLSLTLSLLNRIMVFPCLAFQCLPTLGPRRWLRSTWSLDTGTSMSLLMIWRIFSVVSSASLPVSGIPLNLRFERREYCSTLSDSSSSVATFLSSFFIFSSRSLTFC